MRKKLVFWLRLDIFNGNMEGKSDCNTRRLPPRIDWWILRCWNTTKYESVMQNRHLFMDLPTWKTDGGRLGRAELLQEPKLVDW